MAPTPRSNLSAKIVSPHNHSRTPQVKQRLNFVKDTAAAEHPVEVIGRIRDNKPQSNQLALHLNADGKSMRVKTEIGYRDFTLDGVSLSDEQDLDAFYRKFVESRINGVKVGQKCTIMMYGPTGSGKSHTMFGCPNQPGIVYNSLKGILGEALREDEQKLGLGTFVQVTVLEIYNEEIYDLLSSTSNAGGFSFGWPKNGSATKVRLEVMGKKAKNATFIAGNEAGKILKEIQKVEKRRIVKSTLCNERSSRSHCMIIVDVPTVGGRLMLVDMAGSENIEQAGQNGLEAKMQTAKINQGNIALKRVVESIANGDSHVPFRDSKLTMLLQDSFEDDKSKILMVLCASPDPKELHKTIATLEYGAKAKCIVRGPHTPIKDKGAEDSSSTLILGSRITALDQFICKLQMENKHREKERNEAQKALQKREEEVSMLRAKLAAAEGRGVGASEEEINSKVRERTLMLKGDLERKIQECQRMADEFLEMERRKMEERMFQQQQEVEMLRRRLENIESELRLSRATSGSVEAEDGTTFMRKLLETCSEESDMVKSMDLSKSIDLETNVVYKAQGHFNEGIQSCLPSKTCLTTVYEDEEYENEEDKDNVIDEEVQKEVIEEKKMIVTPEMSILYPENPLDDAAASSRQLRIQNIFTLCGNYRELSHNNVDSVHDDPENTSTEYSDGTSQLQESISKYLLVSGTPKPEQQMGEDEFGNLSCSAEITKNVEDRCSESDDDINVYVKWEASKENPGKFITALKISKDSTLADLRKLIDIHLGGGKQDFTFLALGDALGSPVPKDKEGATQTSKLPICSNHIHGHLACLRPANPILCPAHLPFASLENKLPAAACTPNSNFIKKSRDCSLPELPEHLASTPFITRRRH